MIELYGNWGQGAEKDLEWCEYMVSLFEGWPKPDAKDKALLAAYRQKRDELRAELGVKAPAPQAEQLDLLEV